MYTNKRRTTSFGLILLISRSLQSYGGYLLEPRSFRVRLATELDIPAIRNCNLATLPENYSDDFYKYHLSTWPTLAIIAEKEEDNTLIGYTLGRIDIKPNVNGGLPSHSPTIPLPSQQQVAIGHVASIAVYSQYRKLGVAKTLMNMLHIQIHPRFYELLVFDS